MAWINPGKYPRIVKRMFSRKWPARPSSKRTPSGGRTKAQISLIKVSTRPPNIKIVMLQWLKHFFVTKSKPAPPAYPHNTIRRIVDTDTIRQRLNAQGWIIRELPIRRDQTVARWKLVAIKGEKTVEVQGTTLESAFDIIGKTLGVIAR